ncbi:MAG: AMP-binding protein [Alphaproteobacteria bacterium]|nr:AMP-binding protein [Alphaproteobacteria bacterium]
MARYCLAGGATTTPHKPALIVIADPTQTEPAELWTFAQLEDAVLRLAGGLRASGLKRGDRLMIRLDNTSLYPITFFACLAAGIVALPTSTQLTAKEAGFMLHDSDARAVAIDANHEAASDLPARVKIIDPETISNLARTAPRADWTQTRADEPAYLIYTSGTTANPKGVRHAHRAAWGRRPMYKDWYGISASDRMLHAGAFNWTYTLGTGLTDPWANGATAIIYTGEKSPEIWPRLIEKTQATLFAAVPGLIRQILKYAPARHQQLGSLRHALIAGETPPANLFEDWQAATGTQLYEALGMSEISTYISSSPSVPRKPGTVGKAQSGRRIAILPLEDGETPLHPGEDGLIAVHRSDPGLMLGYLNRPEEEAAVMRGDWFIGGDIGRIDEDGYITHLGRANDIMKALGYRVAPQEVEAALTPHPAVAEVACAEVRVRDDLTVIGAFIVPVNPQAPPSQQTILEFAAKRLAGYKQPREIRFVDALPKTPNGKIIRSQLAAL